MFIARTLGGLVLVALVACPLLVFGAVDKLGKLTQKVRDIVDCKLETLEMQAEDLRAIYADYMKLSAVERAELEADPITKLTIDFALKPCKNHHHQLTLADELANENYMIRLARALRLIWPAYEGRLLRRVSCIERIPKIKKLVLDLKEGKTPGLKELLAAKRERASLLARAREILDCEDVFSNLKEYAQILQTLNWTEFKRIQDEILSRVSPSTSGPELASLLSSSGPRMVPAP